jgi:hypothetical protein
MKGNKDNDTTDLFEEEGTEVSFPLDPDEFVVWLSQVIGRGYSDSEIDSLEIIETAFAVTGYFLQNHDELTMPSLELH